MLPKTIHMKVRMAILLIIKIIINTESNVWILILAEQHFCLVGHDFNRGTKFTIIERIKKNIFTIIERIKKTYYSNNRNTQR